MRRSVRCIGLLLIILPLLIYTGCSSDKSLQISNNDSIAIEKYLDEKVLKPAFGGKVFSAHKVLGTDQAKVYVWALLQEYYKTNNSIEKGTGWSVPLVLVIENGSNGITVLEHKYPGDGTKFAVDVKTLFPNNLQKGIFDFPSTQGVRDLEKYSKERAERWANSKA